MKATNKKRKSPSASAAVRIAVCAAALAGLVWVNLTLYINVGNILGTLLFGVIFCCSAFADKLARLIGLLWKKSAGRVVLLSAAACAAAGVGLCAFFSVNMARFGFGTDSNVKADCVIVLGCQVQGETPTYMLCDRLNAALTVLEKNPGAKCVVSGGQGPRESITEAEAMRRYLVARGIADERIICEEKATSTRENLLFSSEKIEERGITGDIVVVTNEFHQYRAHIYAVRAGLDESGRTISHYSAKTEPRLRLNYWIREWAGLAMSAFNKDG